MRAMKPNKDSDEIVKFQVLYSKVKEYCDNVPDNLIADVERDSSVKELCNELHWAAFLVQANDRRRHELFTAPVDPEFLLAWRDFEERYDRVLSQIIFADIIGDLGDAKTPEKPKAEFLWECADEEAADRARAIKAAIDFARDQAEGGWQDFPDGFAETIEDGISAWNSLVTEAGFDLRGAFRRRELVPFVLIPRHLADRQGSKDRLSIYKNLQQAHDAFIFGAPFASLALMRSIMEAVLRDHYGAQGRDLSEQIDNARDNLPKGANPAALHRLRRLANMILHLDAERAASLPDVKTFQLEKEIVSLLFVVRALIEGAPQRRMR
jgi:Domain of unknown function (DUF4145)